MLIVCAYIHMYTYTYIYQYILTQNHRNTEPQIVRGWKGSLWVI